MLRAMTGRSPTSAFRMMRRVDEFFGPTVCLALRAARAAMRRVRGPGKRAPAPVAKILVIKFWGMGSIVLATPTLRALKGAYPGAQITFLTFEQNERLCRSVPSIDRVHSYRAASLSDFLLSFATLVRFLRAERFDVVIDLEFFANFTAIITALSGAPITVGYDGWKSWRRPFYTNPFAFNHKHITEVFLKAAQTLGAEVLGTELDVPIVSDSLRAARLSQVLRDRGIAPTDRLICININASPLEYKRRWPLGSYKVLIERLLANFDAFRLVLIGSGDDVAYVEGLLRSLGAHPRLVNLCGLIEVDQLALFLRRVRLFIGNDSGPLHLAVAMGTPTVSFFGPETPALYGPRGENHTVLYKNIPCSPCLDVYNSKENSACRNNLCMQAIDVEEAWAAVCQRLAESPPRAALQAVGAP